ncbi:cytochrome c oxidase subunit II [Haloarchaeobius amylolyticus]|uniref:cytochrome c oxidase subunit II n=1 Tax=Haloarchaeobius amylolyticus TaxID=1198296 RepID=UPI0022713767|nr:cytochrome c oxidase subunit II [Haloarchaeobius amylolyticus]
MYGGTVLQAGGSGGIVPEGSRAEIFSQIFEVFVALGALVGVVVLSYMLYNAYKYRDHDGRADEDEYERPVLGEIPTGGGHGRKLLLSFTISAVIVVSLVLWTYGALLYVEQGAAAAQPEPDTAETMTIEVTGYQYGWKFTYPNGERVDGTLRVPEGKEIRLKVTSEDVFHNFGVPALRVKTDAVPGQTTTTWFGPAEAGEYQAQCYELCGAGHSFMVADVIVMEQSEFDQWYENMGNNTTSGGSNSSVSHPAATEVRVVA